MTFTSDLDLMILFLDQNLKPKDPKRGTKDTKGTVKLINLKQTDNAMAENKKDKQKNNSTHDTT